MQNLFNEMQELNSLELEQLKAIKYLLEESDDIASAVFSMGNCKVNLPITHAEVIAMFIDFLDNAINYYKQDVL